jgi:hypothetical protein
MEKVIAVLIGCRLVIQGLWLAAAAAATATADSGVVSFHLECVRMRYKSWLDYLNQLEIHW